MRMRSSECGEKGKARKLEFTPEHQWEHTIYTPASSMIIIRATEAKWEEAQGRKRNKRRK